MFKPFFRTGFLIAVLTFIASMALSAASANAAPLRGYAVVNIFKIGGVGGWDYARLNDAGTLLFVTRATHTNVIDTATGKVVADIPDNDLSHGVALVPSLGRGFISNGRSGTVTIFDLKTYATIGTVKTDLDSDGIIYDPASDRVIVVCGDMSKMYAINPHTGEVAAEVDLVGQPEYLASDGQGKVFININDKNEVAVIDTKTMKVITNWPLGSNTGPTGMGIDPMGHRLFIGCRGSKTMVVMSSDDGQILATEPIGAIVDTTCYYHGHAFASCGDGTLTIVGETTPGNYSVLQVVKTAPGARTMALDSNTGRIYMPTADMAPSPTTSSSTTTRRRMRAIPGTFKIVVVDYPPA
ncbi:MAG TPA: YncE family protein [Phycisphaerae bacterium]|nr:YncE family protein [Phycisphaerae bacterium]